MKGTCIFSVAAMLLLFCTGGVSSQMRGVKGTAKGLPRTDDEHPPPPSSFGHDDYHIDEGVSEEGFEEVKPHERPDIVRDGIHAHHPHHIGTDNLPIPPEHARPPPKVPGRHRSAIPRSELIHKRKYKKGDGSKKAHAYDFLYDELTELREELIDAEDTFGPDSDHEHEIQLKIRLKEKIRRSANVRACRYDRPTSHQQ